MQKSPGLELRRIGDEAGLEALLRAERAVLYKHSPICGSSALAASQIRRFVETHPAVPVFLVDVIAERELSRRLARELGVGHESPQVILLREGQACWNGSHFEVTAERITRHLADCDSAGRHAALAENG